MTEPNVGADISVVYLDEGYVLSHHGYTVALTNADDLAERVRSIARDSEHLSEPGPIIGPTPVTVAPAPSEPVPPTPELREATAVPSATQVGPAQGLSLEQEWANARMLIAFFAAGFDTNGKAFLRKDFDAALPMFAPHIDSKEVEFELGEFLAGMHDDED